MLSHHHTSYVIGNSWQLKSLNDEQKMRLDSEPWVLCCNRFMSNWREAGFRPTVWVYGDTRAGRNVSQEIITESFRQELNAIEQDEELHERLQYIFICLESDVAREILKEYKFPVPVTIYQRYGWTDPNQKLANNLKDRIFHYGGTLTDVINIANILVGGIIKISGCQYMTRWGHFYDEPHGDEEFLPIPQSEMANKLWTGLSIMRNYGINIIDCNFEHGQPIPEKYRLETGRL